MTCTPLLYRPFAVPDVAAAGVFTGCSQPCVSGASPLTIWKNRCWICLGHGTSPATADLHPVNRSDWRHLNGGADEEYFVRDVERLARQRLLAHVEAELAGDGDHGIARDTRQHRVADRRRMDDPFTDDEDVLAAALAQVAVGVERNTFGVPLRRALPS